MFSKKLRIRNGLYCWYIFQEINDWVEAQTNSRIMDLVTKKDLEDARFVIINAIYFKGDWPEKFDPSKTKLVPFYTAEDKFREVNQLRTLPISS